MCVGWGGMEVVGMRSESFFSLLFSKNEEHIYHDAHHHHHHQHGRRRATTFLLSAVTTFNTFPSVPIAAVSSPSLAQQFRHPVCAFPYRGI